MTTPDDFRYPVPTASPYTDIAQYIPLLLTAVENTFERPDVWPEGQEDTALGYIGDLKAWLMERLVVAGLTVSGELIATNSTQHTFEGKPDGTFNLNVLFDTYYSTNTGSRLIARRAKGTKASPSALTAFSEILGLEARGWVNGAFTGTRANFRFFAAEDWTPSAQGTEARLEVTPNGAVSPIVALRIGGASGAPTHGFFGGAPIGKPTVTGSRGGNAALTSLLTALASLNLIVNNTTA